MLKMLAADFICIAAIGASCLGILGTADNGNNGPNKQQCYEDMSCWNCQTMGNKICGGHSK